MFAFLYPVQTIAVSKNEKLSVFCHVYLVYLSLLSPFLTPAVDASAFYFADVAVFSKVVQVVHASRMPLTHRSIVFVHSHCSFLSSVAVFTLVHSHKSRISYIGQIYSGRILRLCCLRSLSDRCRVYAKILG